MKILDVPHLLGPDGFPLFSLLDINRLPVPDKEKIYAALLPDELMRMFSIDPGDLSIGGQRRVLFICPAGLGLVRIEVRPDPEDRDSVFFVELADTPFRQIELSFCVINDPTAPRFGVDVDPQGRDNLFGTVRRNVPVELEAMKAGLAPNQVRRGLRLFAPFLRRLEHFVASLGIDSILGEPLSYDNAIRFEGYGFDYLTGKQFMLWIDREFREGGELFRRLDNSTPFRRPGQEKSVRGRSWAIHDGILERPWDGLRIYKIPGVHAGIDTFPDRVY